MTQKTNVSIVLLIVMVLSAIACNEQTPKDETTKTDVSKSDSAVLPAYDPAMDPVKVESAYNKVLADTLNIKLHEVTLNPGDSVGMHTHPDFTLYILQGGTLKIYPKDGEPQVLELKTGMGLIFPTVTHSGINIGTTTIKLLVSDIYRPRS